MAAIQEPVPELEVLHTAVDDIQSPAVFIHNSQLRSLSLFISGDSVEQPANLLQHLPQLTSLSLDLYLYGECDRGPGLSALPGLLTHTPRLEDLHLSLTGHNCQVLLTDLLVPVPHLASLVLHIPWLEDLPADLLVPTPPIDRPDHPQLDPDGIAPGLAGAGVGLTGSGTEHMGAALLTGRVFGAGNVSAQHGAVP